MSTAPASAAIFTRRPAPEYGRGAEEVVVDCDHGTTTVTLLPSGRPERAEAEVTFAVAMAVWRHYTAEGCACTRRLRRLYSRDGVN